VGVAIAHEQDERRLERGSAIFDDLDESLKRSKT
jgi:hypothetical protein